MMNSTAARFKMSKIEKETNKQIVLVFIVQVICCFIAALIGTFMQYDLNKSTTYLGRVDLSNAARFVLTVVKQTGTWILIFT